MKVPVCVEIDDLFLTIKERYSCGLSNIEGIKSHRYKLPWDISLRMPLNCENSAKYHISYDICAILKIFMKLVASLKRLIIESSLPWIPIENNETLNRMSDEINTALFRSLKMPLHNYGCDRKCHVSILHNEEQNALRECYNRVKGMKYVNRIDVESISLLESDTGKEGTYRRLAHRELA